MTPFLNGIGSRNWAIEVASLPPYSRGVAADSSSLDFTNLNLADFAYLFLLSHMRPATDGALLFARTSTDNGSAYDAGASDYDWAWAGRSTSGAITGGDGADSEVELTAAMGNVATEAASGFVWLLNPAAAEYATLHYSTNYSTTAGVFTGITGAGRRLSAADANAIRFIESTGNITSGEIRCYRFAI